MLDQMIKNLMENVKERYPHIESPPAVRAVITSARRTEETYTSDVVITEKATGESKKCTIEQHYYIYSVKPADNEGNVLNDYPVIPSVKSKTEYKKGDMVTVVFTGGELYASIAGD